MFEQKRVNLCLKRMVSGCCVGNRRGGVKGGRGHLHRCAWLSDCDRTRWWALGLVPGAEAVRELGSRYVLKVQPEGIAGPLGDLCCGDC